VSAKSNAIKLYSVERVLAILGAATCLTVTTVVWLSVTRQQEMWPLPAFYFIEVVALSVVAAWGIFRADQAGGLLAWAVIGALVGFSIMGALSVGFFYLPVAALLSVAALRLDRQDWRRRPLHLGLALVTAVAQAALMLSLIRVLYPNAAF
jgi:hypothetical protein